MLKFQNSGHQMRRTDSLEKTLMLGKIEGRRKREQQRMRWLDGITDSTDMSVSRLQKIVKDREAWRAAVPGAAKSRTQLSDWKRTWRQHRTPPATLHTNAKSRLLFVLQTSYRQFPPNSSLDLINLLQRLTELRRPIHSWDHHLITKDIKGYESSSARWRDRQGRSIWEAEHPPALQDESESPTVLQPSSLNPILLGFYGDFTTKAW